MRRNLGHEAAEVKGGTKGKLDSPGLLTEEGALKDTCIAVTSGSVSAKSSRMIPRSSSNPPWILFVEGLPGSGKSTSARKLSETLPLEHLCYEENHPENPVGFLWRGDTARSAILDTRLDRYPFAAWDELASSGKNVILESRLLQNTLLFTMLNGSPESEGAGILQRILEALSGYRIGLIYLQQSDPLAHTLQTLESRRISHPSWEPFIQDLFSALPWCQQRQLQGTEAFVQSMLHWADQLDAAVERLSIPKAVLTDPWRDFARSEEKILSFCRQVAESSPE